MNDYPLIKFVIIFICGIILETLLNIETKLLLIIAAAAIPLTIVLTFIRYEKLYSIKRILIVLSIIVYAMLHLSISQSGKADYPFQQPKNKNALITGTVTNVELIREERIIFHLRTDSIRINGITQSSELQLLCTLRDSKTKLKSFYNKVKIGNVLKLKATIVRARDERNPGEFDYEKYLLNKGISAITVIYKVRDINFVSDEVDVFPNLVFNIRKDIDEKVTALHNKTTGGFIRGLILGDRSMIEGEVQTDFVNAGVVHVLSVSGLHVGFIILIFVFLFQRFNLYVRFACTLIGLAAYVIITNFQPPVTRAAIMGISILLAPVSGRNTNSINSLAFAAFAILLFNPNDLFNPGFQLSFSAILSIIIFYPVFSKKINELKIKSKFLKNILLFCSVSIAAQAGTLPFTLVYFHKLSLISIIANLVVIPVSGFIVELGIFTVALGYLSGTVAYIFASANELQTYLLFWFVNSIGKLSISFIRINAFSLYDGILFYFVLFFVFNIWKRLVSYKAKVVVIIFSVFVSILLFRVDNYQVLQDNKLSIMTIDIGQGDSFLIKFPNGETALIDAGDANSYFDNGKNVIAPLLDRLGIDRIDWGFISHVDADHYRGFFHLVNEERIKQIYKPRIDSTLDKDIELEKFLNEKGIPIKYYSKNYLKIGNARLYILNDTTRNNYTALSTNDKSGVFKLIYGNSSFLFTGDAGIKAEKFYVSSYNHFLDSDIIKAGHHGSKTSSSQLFVDVINPEIAVISAGVANKFKHPNKEILQRFEKAGARILRTDLSGAILLQSDGNAIENINWKKQESGFIF